jgi:hypothetical protein
MISFDCPGCGKPLIVPNSRTGTVISCPGCRDGVLVPEPRPPSKTARRFKLLFFVATAVGLAVLVALFAGQARRPRVIQHRLYANLQEASPLWGQVGWHKCDPRTGEYHFTASYSHSGGSYEFETDSYEAAGRTIVHVNPSRNNAQWLARASFTQGEQDAFRYAGGDEDEKRDLNILIRNLVEALRDATR